MILERMKKGRPAGIMGEERNTKISLNEMYRKFTCHKQQKG